MASTYYIALISLPPLVKQIASYVLAAALVFAAVWLFSRIIKGGK
ncbi:MAG: hypothetical protein RR998_02055 [Oscillospiraceae bacterium]